PVGVPRRHGRGPARRALRRAVDRGGSGRDAPAHEWSGILAEPRPRHELPAPVRGDRERGVSPRPLGKEHYVNDRSHILVLAAAVVALFAIFRLVRVQQLRSKYALLWLTLGVLLIPIAVVPGASQTIADWVGVSTGRALFELAAIGLLFLVVMHFSWEL